MVKTQNTNPVSEKYTNFPKNGGEYDTTETKTNNDCLLVNDLNDAKDKI